MFTLTPARRQRIVRALLVLPLCLVILVTLDYLKVFGPSGRWLYDHAAHLAYQHRWASQSQGVNKETARPLLIAIDEASLQGIGRWPWSRSVHAQLIEQLASSPERPAVMAWDVMFSEPQTEGVVSLSTDEDAQLAKAINASGFPIVLATQFETVGQQLRLIAPREPLVSSAARIAHIQIETDADGAVRQYQPIDEGGDGLLLPYLGKAMSAPAIAPPIRNLRQVLNPNASQAVNSSKSQPLPHTTAAKPAELLYPMPNAWIRTVSYQAVLSGEVKPQVWANAPVIVGATAKGLGDQYVSHVISPSTMVSGAELVLAALHTESMIAQGLPRLQFASSQWQWFAVLLMVGFVYVGLRRSVKVKTQVWVVGAALLVVAVACIGLLAYAGIWLNAAQLIFAVLLMWVLWMSHALQRLLMFLLGRLQQTNTQPSSASSLSRASHKPTLQGDAIEDQLSQLDVLEARKAAEFKRLSEVLELLPDAAFVFKFNAPETPANALQANVQNRAARRLCERFPRIEQALAHPKPWLNDVLVDFSPDLTRAQKLVLDSRALSTTFQWQLLQTLNQTESFAQGVEANAANGERYLIKLAPLPDALLASGQGSFVLSIVDLSVSQALAQSREQTLNFLSHDLRAPQATILALIGMEKSVYPSLAPLFSKISFQAERTLQLAESFVQWSQASHRPAYQFAEYNLNDLVVEALDEQWASAKQLGVGLVGDEMEQPLWVNVDRNLMWRVLVNLIRNALNACESSQTQAAQIRLTTRIQGAMAVVCVQDNGPGIAPERQASLFEPFVQGQGIKRTGAGLGLAFVKTVMDQHRGQVRLISPVFESPAAHGTRFELHLPLLLNAALMDE
jgi:signal transduction histidine kinase/CHASE2 domain-containing sensor protein